MYSTYAVVTLTTENPGACGFERYQDRHCPPYCAELITDFQSAKSMRTESSYIATLHNPESRVARHSQRETR